jgi:hypothetical protein
MSIPSLANQSWQPATSREALAQHCAAFSSFGFAAWQQFFAFVVVSVFVCVSGLVSFFMATP